MPSFLRFEMSEIEPQVQRAATDSNLSGTRPAASNRPEGTEPPVAGNAGQSDWHSPLRRFGLNRGDQLFAAFFIVVALILMTANWLRMSGWGMRPVEIQQLEPREQVLQVDVNRATWVEWSQLEGIGPALAHRIVEDRERNGPFHSVDDVQRVPGIGPKRIEQLRPWLVRRELSEQ